VSEAHTTIAYDGPALEHGTMDVRDLAPALLAVGTLCDRANKVLNGSKATVQINVRTGFKPGSFGVDLALVHTVVQQAKAFLLSDNVTAALNLLGLLGFASGTGVSVIALIKWLRGRRPQSVTTLENGNVRIEVIVDLTVTHKIEIEYIEVSPDVAKLYNDVGVRSAAKEIVAPLERPGIETFETKTSIDGAVIERVTKAELPAFTVSEPAQTRVTGSEYETVLQIVKPSFDERLTWTFFDGERNIFVDIEDEAFFAEVQRRERSFAKGDLLRVVLFAESFVNESGQISTRRVVRRVIEQIQPPRQLPLIE